MTSKSNIGNVSLTGKVIQGHWRSELIGHWRAQISYWGHALTTTLRDAIFCMYIHMKSIDICSLTILTSKVNKGHWRSQTKRHKPTRECAPMSNKAGTRAEKSLIWWNWVTLFPRLFSWILHSLEVQVLSHIYLQRETPSTPWLPTTGNAKQTRELH